MTKEAKMQIVVDNYFKSECDVNTSIRKAFEKGFRIGVQKGSVDAEPVKHGEWRYDEALELEWCSECGFGKRKGDKRWYSYCPNCGAYMGVVKHETC